MCDTVQTLLARVAQGEDPLLTLREVARLSDTPHSTIKRWVYTYRALPIERVGPYNRPRVRATVFIAFFPVNQ